MTCTARQHSDQMICERCALQWDVNDPDPPQCNPVHRTTHTSAYDPGAARRRALKKIKAFEL